MRIVRLLTLLTGLLTFVPIQGRLQAEDAPSVYHWTDADLAFYLEAGWGMISSNLDQPLTLMNPAEDSRIVLQVYADGIDSARKREHLDDVLASLAMTPLRYDLAEALGRTALTVQAVDFSRTRIGLGTATPLPDNRLLVAVGDAPNLNSDALQQALVSILNSMVFSADATPTPPGMGILWTNQGSTEIVLTGLARGRGSRLYGLDPGGGINVIDAQTGILVTTYPFDNPAQATGIAADQQGIVAVGDRACRCIRRMNEEGRWLDPVGRFEAGAPYSVATAPDGTIYAVDGGSDGYRLAIIGTRQISVSLDFNASSPPSLSVDPDGRLWVLEWLRSMIDDQVSAAVSTLTTDDKPTLALQFWLVSLTPRTITSFSASRTGLAFGDSAQGILLYDDTPALVDVYPTPGVEAITIDADSLFAFSANEGLSAFSSHAPPLRFGGRLLVERVPAIGRLSEDQPTQTWELIGSAGDSICIQGADQNRTSEAEIGIDMALHLLAPDGSEIGYNDDQSSGDLFGIYDSQICPVRLPQDGVYTVVAEWRQGTGVYTIAYARDQKLDLNGESVMQLSGYIYDVLPADRWHFAGHVGQSLTVTMTATDGDLDPRLELDKPNGSLLASNDDAADPDLGVNAQIAQVRLPEDGEYVIKAGRWEGSGHYALIVVVTTP